MKKQILFLTMFTLALIFAGTTNAFAQSLAVPNSAPQTVACSPDALHPTAGIPYSYTLDATPGGGTWTWYATKNKTFMSGAVIPSDSLNTGTDLFATSPNYGTTGSSNEVTINWSEAILANTEYQTNPTFVVGYYTASGSGTECADNIKIFELDPVNAFVVDIKNINPADNGILAYGTNAEQCVDNVQSATYTAANNILYDYGTNYLYYEWVAANFSDYWVPTFTLTGLDASQTLTYEYTYANPSTWSTTPPTWTTLTSGTTQIEVDPSVTTTAAGVSVYVRVTVENNTFETLLAQTAVLTLDGQNPVGGWDVQNNDCGEPDPNAADQNDVANQIINPRPTVEEGTTSTITPNEQLVPKQ